MKQSQIRYQSLRSLKEIKRGKFSLEGFYLYVILTKKHNSRPGFSV